jgi:8-oxo-dGTP pyrophosphatase MutT (NUDIX family)
VTSRETQRWLIPKGWPDGGRPPRVVAAREAREEAGVIGKIRKRPIGTFQYEKRLSPETSVVCEVIVYLLKVTKQLTKWPEMASRERCWLPLDEAALRVTDRELSGLLLNVNKLFDARR